MTRTDQNLIRASYGALLNISGGTNNEFLNEKSFAHNETKKVWGKIIQPFQ